MVLSALKMRAPLVCSPYLEMSLGYGTSVVKCQLIHGEALDVQGLVHPQFD